MAWQMVAEGVSIFELEQRVADMELPKGSKMRVIMDSPFWWVFDVAGAELVFRPFMPSGMDLIDVYGENGKGYVDMEADPAWLVATLAFIKAHWLAIIIAGFVLTAIVSFIRIMVEVVTAPSPILAALILIGVVLLAMVATRKPIPKKERK